MLMPVYLEVSALFEAQWTGIPTVVAAIAKHAIADPATDWRFVYETIELPRPLVVNMIAERTGTTARRAIAAGVWEGRQVTRVNSSRCKAIFTSIKPMRRLFGEEAMIIYDLSPLLTPQFHNVDTINHFGNRIRGDVESSEHFFPISEASRGDLETYFGIDRSASTIIPMGIDIDLNSLSIAQDIARTCVVEPYVVVLGTLEPRKNGRLVLEYLARNPSFGHRFKVVFVGRDGWLDERERLIQHAEAAGVPRGRIIFTGYISEQEKVSLLYNCAFCIYASFFEGYGLPILEAAVFNKLIVCSNTSSMPEVAPSQSLFFDPNSLLEFSRAIRQAEQRSPQLRPSLALSDVVDRLGKFGWERCYEGIKAWVHS